MMTKCSNCNNCAWFCHSDGKCYGNHFTLVEIMKGIPTDARNICGDWSFDGLEDWEREELDTLVTMDEVSAWQD